MNLSNPPLSGGFLHWPTPGKMFAEWVRSVGQGFAGEVFLREASSGRAIGYRELPACLRQRAKDRGWQGPGWLICRGGNDFEAVLDLLAGALAGLWICPLPARWPRARTVTWLEQILPPSLGQVAARAGANHTPQFWPGPVPAAGGGTVLATSGSSGTPKAVFHRWESHVEAVVSSCGPQARVPLQPGDSWLLDFALAHVSGLGVVLRCLATGATVVVGGQPRTTHRSLVATTLRRALDDRHFLPPLKLALVGGGPISWSLVQEAVSQGWPIRTTYGMTETSAQFCTSTTWTPSDFLSAGPALRTAPVGKVLPERQVRADAEGQLWVRGAGLLWGYGRSGRVTDTARDAEGWFATGDVGTCSPEGVWTIYGRRDRRFKCGGENIAPEAIEAALLALPGVEAAAVLPVADAEYGARPVAFVRGRGAVAQWRSQLRQQVSGLEMPLRWLQWPSELTEINHKSNLEKLAQILASESASLYSLPEHS